MFGVRVQDSGFTVFDVPEVPGIQNLEPGTWNRGLRFWRISSTTLIVLAGVEVGLVIALVAVGARQARLFDVNARDPVTIAP